MTRRRRSSSASPSPGSTVRGRGAGSNCWCCNGEPCGWRGNEGGAAAARRGPRRRAAGVTETERGFGVSWSRITALTRVFLGCPIFFKWVFLDIEEKQVAVSFFFKKK